MTSVDFSTVRLVRALFALAVTAMATAGPAAALQPGVFVDPNSPAGKEYSFPLDVQRGAAVGHTAPQGVAQPLFGVGIGPAGAQATATGHSAGAPNPTRGPNPTGPKPAHGIATRRTAPPLSQRSQTPAAFGLAQPHSTTSELSLIGVPVVLGGLLAGLAIAIARRRRA